VGDWIHCCTGSVYPAWVIAKWLAWSPASCLRLIGWVGLGCATYLLIFLLSRWGGSFFRSARVLAGLADGLDGCRQPVRHSTADGPVEIRCIAARGHGKRACVTALPLGTVISSILYLMQSMLGLWLVVWSNSRAEVISLESYVWFARWFAAEPRDFSVFCALTAALQAGPGGKRQAACRCAEPAAASSSLQICSR
jgi:hypothetical protein